MCLAVPMFKPILFALLVLFFESRLLADTICYNDKTAVIVRSIGGWIADEEAGKKNGLCTIFYLEGFTFGSSPAIFYPSLVDYSTAKAGDSLSIESYIDTDLLLFKSRKADVNIQSVDAYSTKDGLKFTIKNILEARPPSEFETVSYLPAKQSVFMGILSARTKENLKKYYKDLKKFLDQIVIVERSKLFDYYLVKADDDMIRSDKNDKMHFTGEFLKSLNPKIKAAFTDCKKKDSPAGKVDVVLEIDLDGVVKNWINRNDTTLNTCIRDKMLDVSLTKPPFAPYFYMLRAAIQD